MMLLYANINRLVEGWDIAYGEPCSLRAKPLLSPSMNLELVSIMLTFIHSFSGPYVCCCQTIFVVGYFR